MWGWGLAAGRLCFSELSVMGVWGGSWWSHQQGFEVKSGGWGKLPQGLEGAMSWEHSRERCFA